VFTSRNAVRLILAGLVLASVGAITHSATAADDGLDEEDIGTRVAPPTDGATVVTTDSNSWLARESNGPRATSALLVIDSEGYLQHYNDTYTRYWDVDPVAGTAATLEYVATDHLPAGECGKRVCTRNVVERVNLTTGESTRIYARITPGKHATRWHDVDRLDENRIVVADIAQDRVFIVDTTTGIVTWVWDARSAFPPAGSGGPYPSDWTHINDVEVLPNGRIMVSVRNQDRVEFLDRERGVQWRWELGKEDEYETLYKQHNPDYIPPGQGGSSVLVADSENDRLVEYQRRGESWERTWTWRDDHLQWPRDADRLPDGRTLVTDSNGNRLLEVARNGTVVWSVEIAFPYEAERLGTAHESDGGPSATSANLQNRHGDGGTGGEDSDTADSGTGSVSGGIDSGVARILRSVPGVNAALYVAPVWVGYTELGLFVLIAGLLLTWVTVEWYWSPLTLSVSRPLEVNRR